MSLSPLAKSTLVGGFLAACLDGAYISVFTELRGGSATGVWRYVASGALGPDAFSGGPPTVVLGLAFHLVVAMGAALLFSLLAARLPWLLGRGPAVGLVYGIGVHLFMQFVVVPLSATPPSNYTVKGFLLGLIPHLVCVGLPIAWAARRYLGGSVSPARP